MAPCTREQLTIMPLPVDEFMGMLVVMLAVAKTGGFLMQKLGQPAVLGELIGGVLVGRSWLGIVNPEHETIHLLSELGVVILLFAIGLETDLGQLIKVGTTSLTVAVVGVALPFALGFIACLLLGFSTIVSVMAGATLTATSVGITARVLADLGRLGDTEGQIILGAAVIDDILGLMILTVVVGLTEGKEVSLLGVVKTIGSAIGFLAATIVIGKLVVPTCFRVGSRIELPGTATAMALMTAFGLAWLAHRCGSEVIIGAFAAGLLVVSVPQAREIERGITEIGHFFVPLFFVAVGASVDLRALDPFHPASRFALVTGGVLIVAGVIGKLAAGYAPFWFRGNKTLIGVAMVPRGEVGLIFAQMGLATGVFDAGLFGAVTLMVIVTTLLAPPCLRLLMGPTSHRMPEFDLEGIDDLVTEA